MIKLFKIFFKQRDILEIEKDLNEGKFISKKELLRLHNAKIKVMMDKIISVNRAYESLRTNINYDMIRHYYKTKNK